jgi:carbon storage regulator
MLVLTRKKEEKLQIGQEITITVLRIKGNSVQLGIEAPRAVRVMRQELLATPRSENQPAAACQQVEITLDSADDADAEEGPQQPTARIAARTKAGSTLHAMVAQVFKPIQPERMISV